MSDLFEVIADLLIKFTWKRLFGLCIFCLLIAASFLCYELYTNSMRLARIEKSTKILETLQKIETDGLEGNSHLAKIHKNLTEEMIKASTPQKINISMPESLRRFSEKEAKWKFIMGALIWWILSLRAIYDIYKHDPNAVPALSFCFCISVSVGFIGVLIPTYEHTAWNYIFYPIINFVGLIALIFVADDFRKRITRIREKQA